MVDSVLINTGTTVAGATNVAFADELVGGVTVARSKIMIGQPGVDDGNVSATNPMPVTGTIIITPAGTQDVNLTKVAGAAIAQGHGTAATAIRVELPTDGTGVIASIGSITGAITLPTGASTSALQTTGNTSLAAAVVDLDVLANIAHQRDTSSGGDWGVPALFIRSDVPANGTSVDQRYDYPQMSAGRVWTSTKIDTAIPAGTALIGKVGIDQTTPGTTNAISLSQINATATAVGNGVVGAGVQRVAIASDNTAFSVNATLTAGTLVLGHVITDTGSTTAVTGNVTAVQATGTNLHMVVDSGTVTTVSTVTAVTAITNAVTVVGAAASGATKSGNPVQIGGVFNTTQPTVTNGQAVEAQATARGALIVAPGVDSFAVQSTLQAGSALIGKVGIDQTTPGTTNAISLSQINATTTAVGNGVVGNGVQRVAIASDNTAFSVNATLTAGSLVLGHVITDTGSTTAVTGNVAITAASGSIASGAVASGAFASGSIASGAIASGAIASGAIAAGAIAVGAIAAGATSIADNEDAASADGDRGVKILVRRTATPANTSGTDLDYEMLQINAGRLWASATIDAALPAGAALIGKVGIDQTTPGTTNAVSIAQLGANTVSTGNGASGTGVLRVAQVNDGTGVIATVTNLATIGTSIVPGTAATHLGKAEDAAHTSGDTGVMALAVRNDTAAALAGTTLDYIPVTTNARGATWVSIEDGSGGQVTTFGGGTQYTEGASSAADPIGNNPILLALTTQASQVSNGQNVGQRGTLYGAACVQQVTSTGAYLDSNSGLTVFNAQYSFTRPADTTAYTVGDSVINATSSPTLPNLALGTANGQTLTITDIVITYSTKPATLPLFQMAFANATFTATNDNAAFTLSDAENDTCQFVSISTQYSAVNNCSVSATGLNITFPLGASDTKIYFGLIANNAFTPAASDVVKTRFKGFIVG